MWWIMNQKAKNVFWSEARLPCAQVIQPLIEEEQQWCGFERLQVKGAIEREGDCRQVQGHNWLKKRRHVKEIGGMYSVCTPSLFCLILFTLRPSTHPPSPLFSSSECSSQRRRKATSSPMSKANAFPLNISKWSSSVLQGWVQALPQLAPAEAHCHRLNPARGLMSQSARNKCRRRGGDREDVGGLRDEVIDYRSKEIHQIPMFLCVCVCVCIYD